MNLNHYLLIGACLTLGAPAFAQDYTPTLPRIPGMNERAYARMNARYQAFDRQIRASGIPALSKTTADPDRVIAEATYQISGSTAQRSDSMRISYSGTTRGSKFSERRLIYDYDNNADVPEGFDYQDSYVHYDTVESYGGSTSVLSRSWRTYNAADKPTESTYEQDTRYIFAYAPAGMLSNVYTLRFNGTQYDSSEREAILYNSAGSVDRCVFEYYDSSSAGWQSNADLVFTTNAAGQVTEMAVQIDLMGTPLVVIKQEYTYAPNGKVVRIISSQAMDVSGNLSVVAKDSLGYNGNTLVYRDAYQQDQAGNLAIALSERRYLNAQNLPDSVIQITPSRGAFYKTLAYNSNGLPTRITTYNLATKNPTAESRYYYKTITPAPASVTSVQQPKPLTLAPNPAVNQIRLDNKLGGQFRVLDLNGRLMMEGGLHAAATIGVESLTPGIYSVLVRDAAGETFSGRFVKQ